MDLPRNRFKHALREGRHQLEVVVFEQQVRQHLERVDFLDDGDHVETLLDDRVGLVLQLPVPLLVGRPSSAVF